MVVNSGSLLPKNTRIFIQHTDVVVESAGVINPDNAYVFVDYEI